MNLKNLAEKARPLLPHKPQTWHWPHLGPVQRIRSRLQRAVMRLPSGFPLP